MTMHERRLFLRRVCNPLSIPAIILVQSFLWEGICMNEPLYRRHTGQQTMWANPENPEGTKGGAAKTLNGRKGSPCFFHLKPGETRIMA